MEMPMYDPMGNYTGYSVPRKLPVPAPQRPPIQGLFGGPVAGGTQFQKSLSDPVGPPTDIYSMPPLPPQRPTSFSPQSPPVPPTRPSDLAGMPMELHPGLGSVAGPTPDPSSNPLMDPIGPGHWMNQAMTKFGSMVDPNSIFGKMMAMSNPKEGPNANPQVPEQPQGLLPKLWGFFG